MHYSDAELDQYIESRGISLVLIFGRGARRDAELLAKLPLSWIGPGTQEPIWAPGDCLPLALFESPCCFREAAIAALEKASIPWRIAFTSPSLPGLWAAVEAGLGITLRTTAGLPGSLVALGEQSGLPSLPRIELCLHHGGRQLTPAVAQLKAILSDVLAANIAMIKRAEIV